MKIEDVYLIIGISFLVLGCQDGAAADPEGVVRIQGDEASCAECSIEAVPVVTLGESGPEVGFPSGLVRLDDSRYLLAALIRPAELDLYDSKGRHVRTLGRQGSGPGEYRLVRHLFVRNGRVEVIDGLARRRIILSAGLEFIESHRILGNPYSVLPIGADSLAVSGGMLFRTEVPAAIAVLDSVGDFARSFGPIAVDPQMPEAQLRRNLAAGMEGGIWAATQRRYRLELWSRGGDLRAVVLREPTWFPSDVGSRFRRESPPRPEVDAVRQDQNGLLWIVVSVPDRRWKDQFTDRPADMAFNGDHGRYLDSVIEVLDPVNGLLLAKTRLDMFIRGFIDDDEIYGYWLNEQAEPRVGVIRLKLRR